MQITPALDFQAQELANALLFSPQGRLRQSHTEKMWAYRSYQGSEPAHMIDWRQSARSNQILVREHEKIKNRDIYFYADVAKEAPVKEETTLILLALAYALMKKERGLGWLGLDIPVTHTASLIPTLIGKGLSQTSANVEGNFAHQYVIWIADFVHPSPELLGLLKSSAARGNKGILLHTAESGDLKGCACALAARNTGWPIITMNEQLRPDQCLASLLEPILQETR